MGDSQQTGGFKRGKGGELPCIPEGFEGQCGHPGVKSLALRCSKTRHTRMTQIRLGAHLTRQLHSEAELCAQVAR